MKTSLTGVLWILGILAIMPSAYAQNANANANATKAPLLPVGNLDAFPTLVQTGTHPTLTWDIQYPEEITEIVTIVPPSGPITPKVDLCMEIRVLGASYQIGTDKKGKPIWGSVQAEVKFNGSSSYTQFFYNTQVKVKPSQVYHSAAVTAGLAINFRARAYNGSQWLPWRYSSTTAPNVVVLINGDRPPSTVPAFSQGNIESFLRPYLDAGGYVNIGPKDAIILVELGQTNVLASGFDLQDIVFLVSFDYCKNNNGHGNNVDGVDVSNPGQGGGGPNGQVDPSGPIDDEIR